MNSVGPDGACPFRGALHKKQASGGKIGRTAAGPREHGCSPGQSLSGRPGAIVSTFGSADIKTRRSCRRWGPGLVGEPLCPDAAVRPKAERGPVRSVTRASPGGPGSASRRLSRPSTRHGGHRPDGCHCWRGGPWHSGKRSAAGRPARADATSTIQYRVYGIRAWRELNGRVRSTFRDLGVCRRGTVTKVFGCLRTHRSAEAAR